MNANVRLEGEQQMILTHLSILQFIKNAEGRRLHDVRVLEMKRYSRGSLDPSGNRYRVVVLHK